MNLHTVGPAQNGGTDPSQELKMTTATARPALSFADRIAWEESLLGQTVEACWTSCYSDYSARAEVVRVNRQSLRVRLVEAVTIGGRVVYPAGRELVLPRFTAATWSARNCAEPAVAAQAVA